MMERSLWGIACGECGNGSSMPEKSGADSVEKRRMADILKFGRYNQEMDDIKFLWLKKMKDLFAAYRAWHKKQDTSQAQKRGSGPGSKNRIIKQVQVTRNLTRVIRGTFGYHKYKT
ncbi:hypothetical protein HP456_20670 [Bacillus haikouensis]|uniref:hypothetical protein n=1 Tax=Bacillus haikouensis TaxID=1510468 RepID=UPI001553FA56|nr:hypothetical protein [Bacillus haikouensis]NQD68325.1 hypothetical protein [Bacillus haikouensis]